MKYSLIVLCSLILLSTKLNAQKTQTLKKVLELKIPREGGANAACVAWHPVSKKYYAVMAGNTDFFIGAYNSSGKLLSPASQRALFDVRGLWYNPHTKTLQANGYNDFGWGEYKLDNKGFPTDIKVLYDDMNQPDEQSVGAYNPKQDALYFFNSEGGIDVYKNGHYETAIELYLGKAKDDEDDYSDNEDVLEDYNTTTVVYTGIPNAELGLLNYTNKEIELYSLKDGYMTKKLTLPNDAPTKEFLNFAYCNGCYWLFDTESRIWKGYK
jgi:hypothetical protein